MNIFEQITEQILDLINDLQPSQNPSYKELSREDIIERLNLIVNNIPLNYIEEEVEETGIENALGYLEDVIDMAESARYALRNVLYKR